MSLVTRIAVTSAVASCVMLGPPALAAQDYVQYETQYLIPLPGQSEDLEEALGEHNRRFHNEGAFVAIVRYVVNGPRTGQLVWIMGPGTWTDWDARPADDAHDSDWASNVMAHARNGRVEYWRQMDDLSTIVDQGDDARPLTRVRFFSVENEELWRQTQAQQVEAGRAAGPAANSTTFFDRQFADPDGRNFARVTSHRNWSELDQGGGGGAGGFQQRMVDYLGPAGYEQYREDREAAGITILDEWQQLLPELSGAGSGN